MTESVAIIDYGSGNLKSAAKAFERSAREASVDAQIHVTDDPDLVRKADRIVLPGVGAFADCRTGLLAVTGMRETLEEKVIGAGVPFLGICVGMQLMARRGLEKGVHKGFDWIDGDVTILAPDDKSLKVPHMGWNTISLAREHAMFAGIETGPNGLHAYFVHSYHMALNDPEALIATADYGMAVTAAVGRDNMIGTQFHPEKSQTLGLKLIDNFLEVEAVILFPAIDLKDGQCVRLKLGDMDRVTVFNDSPAAQAKAFEDKGFEYLHVVDLNGAFAGESVNGAAAEAILGAIDIPVQLGGGIRSLAHVQNWLEKGLSRVILGTIAVRDPALVKEACRLFPGKIAVGIDARGGKVAVEGWAETSDLSAVEMARRFEGAGVAAIIYTDIDRDGVLTGINWASTLELAQSMSIPVIASGGLASMDDIEMMTRSEMQVLEGAISGRALYDGRIDAKEALKKLEGISA